jgi:hypothetical protein
MFVMLIQRLASVLAAATLAFVAASPAGAQPVLPQSDAIELVGLVTKQPTPNSPPEQVQFEATVNYRLQSAQTGFVSLFLFENSAEDSSEQGSGGITVKQGSGKMVLTIDYTLRPQVQTLTLVAGLFKGDQRLVAWVSTNAIDMGPWPGRVAFEKAMAARLDNDFAAADAHLSAAIDESPETGNYYYWRADTRVRLEQFDAAVADFSRSIDLMPQDRASRVGRGVSRLWLGQPRPAVEDLSLAIEASEKPDRITAWSYRARGLAHAALGAFPEAIADYQAYLQLSPTANDRAQVEGWIKDIS